MYNQFNAEIRTRSPFLTDDQVTHLYNYGKEMCAPYGIGEDYSPEEYYWQYQVSQEWLTIPLTQINDIIYDSSIHSQPLQYRLDYLQDRTTIVLTEDGPEQEIIYAEH